MNFWLKLPNRTWFLSISEIHRWLGIFALGSIAMFVDKIMFTCVAYYLSGGIPCSGFVCDCTVGSILIWVCIYIYYKMHISIYICTYITHVHNFRHKILIVSSMASTKTRHSRPGRGGKGKKDKQLDARHQCGRCFSWKLGSFLRTGEFTGIFKGGIYGYESKYKVWIKALDPHTIHTPRSIPWSIPHDTAWSIPLIHTPDPYPWSVPLSRWRKTDAGPNAAFYPNTASCPRTATPVATTVVSTAAFAASACCCCCRY